MEEAGWEQDTGTVAESHQWWHRSILTLHTSSAAAFWPEKVILQWKICLITEHWLDAWSNRLQTPHPQPWRHILVPDLPELHILVATSFPHFVLPAICSPGSSFQSTPNPCCRLPFSPSSGPKSPCLSYFLLPLPAQPSRKVKTDCHSWLCTLELLLRKSNCWASLVPDVQPQGRECLPWVVSLENLSAKLRWFPPKYHITLPSIKASEGFP